MSKKSIWILIISAIVVVIAIALSVIFVHNKQQNEIAKKNANNQVYNVYYLDKAKDNLVSEKRQINENGNRLYRKLLDELIKGPQDKDHNVRAIPEGVQVLSVMTDDHTATVNFSKEFKQKNNSDTLLAAYTVAKTLTQLPKTDEVLIKVEGKPIVDNTGKEEGPISDEDIVVGTGANQDKELYVTLYFYNQDATKLEKETRKVNADSDETLEKYVIEELIKGPTQKGLQATLNPDSNLISVQTKDGICYVNFTNDFVSKNTGGSTQEMGAIYSIVDSLTELDDVEKIQFLIDGKKSDTFGNYAFNEPFDRKEDLIDKR